MGGISRVDALSLTSGKIPFSEVGTNRPPDWHLPSRRPGGNQTATKDSQASPGSLQHGRQPVLAFTLSVRVSTAAHEFLTNNPGGHHKGKDPTPVGELAKNRVRGTDTLYIGTSANLNKRLRQFRQFGEGREDTKALLLAEFKGMFAQRPFANLQDS